MYYIKKIVFFVKKIIFIYFDGSGSGSGYPRIIEYRDGYPKPGYPETTNPDPDIKSTDPTDPDPNPDTLNFPDIRIRPRASFEVSTKGCFWFFKDRRRRLRVVLI